MEWHFRCVVTTRNLLATLFLTTDPVSGRFASLVSRLHDLRVKVPIYYQALSYDRHTSGHEPLSDLVVRLGGKSYMMLDFTGPLQWLPLGTDRIIRLSQVVDRGINVSIGQCLGSDRNPACAVPISLMLSDGDVKVCSHSNWSDETVSYDSAQ